MAPGQIVFIVGALVIVVLMMSLLRSRRLREKYAALWMLVSLAVLLLALIPPLQRWLAHIANVANPVNLLFGLAILLLLAVTIHLSLEISRLEDRARTLAEHVAILDAKMRELSPNPVQAQPAALEATSTETIREQRSADPTSDPRTR